MFTKLMDNLSMVYSGEIIYVPEKLKVFIEPWLHQQGAKRSFQKSQRSSSGGFQRREHPADGYRWNKKAVVFFCEDELVKAYKNMPVPHAPEKVTEEAFIIEFTLEERTAAVRESSKPWQQGGAKKVERSSKMKGGKLW